MNRQPILLVADELLDKDLAIHLTGPIDQDYVAWLQSMIEAPPGPPTICMAEPVCQRERFNAGEQWRRNGKRRGQRR